MGGLKHMRDKKHKKQRKRSLSTDANCKEDTPLDKKKHKAKRSKETIKAHSDKNDSSEPFQQPDPVDKSFKKSFYKEAVKTASRTSAEIDAFYKLNKMTISGSKCVYRPVLSFDEIDCSQKALQSCISFTTPTPIQSQCWPILLSGRDIIGIAETGSGKTLAFSIPGLIHIMIQKSHSKHSTSAKMLVVAPTRELAKQSADVITKAGATCGIQCLCIYGGVPKYEQRKKLAKGVDIIVATPGRLNDLLNEEACDLSAVTYTVLDEADRMLDEGFEKDMRLILSCTHKERQIAMFSATWPQSIQKLAQEFLVDPVKVTIGSDDLAASQTVTQIVEVIEDRARDGRVHQLLERYHSSKQNLILIFVLYKKEADRVERMLQSRGWNCTAIHGDRNQHQRDVAVESFKSKKIPILIATDVAARGLDIRGVEYVINYSFPLTIEDYVHRIGRTGRGGKKGIAHTFFTVNDKARSGELVNVLRDSNQTVPEALLKFGTHVKKKEHKLYGAFAKDVDFSKKASKIVFASDEE